MWVHFKTKALHYNEKTLFLFKKLLSKKGQIRFHNNKEAKANKCKPMQCITVFWTHMLLLTTLWNGNRGSKKNLRRMNSLTLVNFQLNALVVLATTSNAWSSKQWFVGIQCVSTALGKATVAIPAARKTLR